MTGKISFLLILCVFLVGNGGMVWGCPEKEIRDPATPIAYASRGDRCEGLFRQQVAASAQLVLLAVHSQEPEFAINSSVPLAVSTPYHGKLGETLNLRVLSSRARLYYRMDTSFPAGTKFLWKRDVINHPSVQLRPTEMKGLLCSGPCNTPEPTVLPVSISEKTPPKIPSITLWFKAAVDLKQLYLSVDNLGGKNVVLKDKDVLEGETLPAGAPKHFTLSLKSGTYRLRAKAVPTDANAMDQIRAKIIIP